MIFRATIFCVILLIIFAPSARPASSGEAACIARTVWLEARGEPIEGQRAVAHVIVNRVRSAGFPDNACAVVNQRGQFARGSVKGAGGASYQRAMVIAKEALSGASDDPTRGATFFYAHRKVRPYWAKKFRTTTIIGNHTFKHPGRDSL